MVGIASYFASVSIKTDDKALRDVDNYLKKIEDKLKKGVNAAGRGQNGKGGLRINAWLDSDKFEKHVRDVFNKLSTRGKPLLLKNVTVDPTNIRKSIENSTMGKPIRVRVTASLDRSSLSVIREQLRLALQNITIGARLGRVSGTGGGSSGGGNKGASSRSTNTPSVTERLAGKPDKSSLSAANRRWFDSMVTQGILGGPRETASGVVNEAVFGGLGRYGSSTMLGRGVGILGNALGGARGGAMGLFAGAALNGITELAVKSWTGLGTIMTAPFKAVSGAASMVTDSFYRIALAAAPAIAGFMYINRTVQQSQQRQIALNTVSKAVGSNGQTESSWLMNMANREGLRYNTLIDPFTTFIASASPAMGLPMAKNVFESFTQFGLTRGANDVSMQLAMKAVSQMAGKGKIQA